MLIIDAIDELPNTGSNSVANLIPNVAQLSDGIFLLVTCRPPAQTSDYTKHILSSLTFDETISIDASGDEYLNVLRNFVAKKTSANAAIVEKILRASDNRLINLQNIIKAYVQIGDRCFENPTGNLFEILRTLYGERYYDEIFNLAVILAAMSIPVTCAVPKRFSKKFMAHGIPICRQTRRLTTIKFSFVVQALAEVAKTYGGKISEIVDSLEEIFKLIGDFDLPTQFDFATMIGTLLAKTNRGAEAENYFALADKFREQLDTKPKLVKNLKVNPDWVLNSISVIKNLIEQAVKDKNLSRYDKAIQSLSRAQGLITDLEKFWGGTISAELLSLKIAVLKTRGNIYKRQEPEKALKYFSKALGILDDLKADAAQVHGMKYDLLLNAGQAYCRLRADWRFGNGNSIAKLREQRQAL